MSSCLSLDRPPGLLDVAGTKAALSEHVWNERKFSRRHSSCIKGHLCGHRDGSAADRLPFPQPTPFAAAARPPAPRPRSWKCVQGVALARCSEETVSGAKTCGNGESCATFVGWEVCSEKTTQNKNLG